MCKISPFLCSEGSMKEIIKKRREGFSLVEALMAVTILGIAAAGVLVPFSSGAAVRAEGVNRTLGTKLACDLMEQVLTVSYDQIVANYNYEEDHGLVKDSRGVVYSDFMYANFSRTVESGYVTVSQESGTGSSKYILATVTVYYDGNEVVSVNRLITR